MIEEIHARVNAKGETIDPRKVDITNMVKDYTKLELSTFLSSVKSEINTRLASPEPYENESPRCLSNVESV